VSGVKIGLLLTGVPELQRALELANSGNRERSKAAIRRGAQAVAADARRRINTISGELASTVRDEYSEDGLVGFVKVGYGKLPRRSRASTLERQAHLKTKRKRAGVKAGKGSYGPVVERGDPRRRHKPHPFLIPALQQHRATIVSELAQATTDSGSAAGLT
jgi:hypothetical protein